MRVRRDYSRPFYGSGRRSGQIGARGIFLFGLLLGAFVVLVSLRFNQLQLTALEIVGQAPTPTPFASDVAMMSINTYMGGDVNSAMQLMAQAVRQQPNNANYLYEYGRMLIEMDQINEAVDVGDRLIALAPGDPRGYAIKARALMWSDPTSAIVASIAGTDVDPTFAPLYAAAGVAYTRLGRWQEGIRNGRRAVELDPMDAFVQRSLYLPYLYVGQYQEAISALETAIALNPNLVAPYFELAFVYSLQQVGEPEMAIAIYNRILEMDPNNARAYLRICETYARVENARFDVAQQYCDEALRVDPNYGPAYRETGRMQYARRNYEGSIESFERCVALGATDIECYYLRGLAHYWLAECETSWNVLQDARTRAINQNEGEAVLSAIETGLYNITQNCEGYRNLPTPAPVLPTAPPPTPIGGGFG